MNIHEIKNEKEWDEYFNRIESPSFLQAWEWGEVQKLLGYKIVRLGLYNKEKLSGIAQVIKIKAKRGNFIFIPHGPISDNPKINSELIKYLKDICNKEGFSHIRISPILEDTGRNRKIYSDAGFKESPIHMHAENIWVLPLNKPEDQLLADMRKTTRYLIRKAIKDGVEIQKARDEQALDSFWKIYQKTAIRENFTPFSKKYILSEFKEFDKTGNAMFFIGKESKNGKVVSAALILFTKSSAFYHQGASLHSKIPVSYLMQWEAIKEALERGCKLYNFWGIAPTEDPQHPWYGLSLFKKGYSGYQIDYLPTQDLVISYRYYLSYLYEKILRWRRKL